MPAIREPAVAGVFYPGEARVLAREIERCFQGPLGPGTLPPKPVASLPGPRLLIAPHAGYVYSGAVAAWGYAALAAAGRPSVAFILGPNHRGLTRATTLEVEGSWRTPLGDSPIHEEVARALAEALPSVEVGPRGGSEEHSLEVQLPFLQYVFGPDLPIVPMMISAHRLEDLDPMAEALASVAPREALIVASTDMSHFLSADEARRLDSVALAAVEALDARGLADAVRRERITMCGWAPTYVGIEAARSLGVRSCRLLRYGHSGEVSGDYGRVVGYASALAE